MVVRLVLTHLLMRALTSVSTVGQATTVHMGSAVLVLLANTLAELDPLPVVRVHQANMDKKLVCLNVLCVHRDILAKVSAKPRHVYHVLLAITPVALDQVRVHSVQVVTITVAWVLPPVHHVQQVTFVEQAPQQQLNVEQGITAQLKAPKPHYVQHVQTRSQDAQHQQLPLLTYQGAHVHLHHILQCRQLEEDITCKEEVVK